MDKKVVFLVGNGFNYFLNQYVNEENRSVLLKKLETEGHSEEDTKIWLDKLKIGLDEYCNLLDFLKLENYSETGETLLSKLNQFFKSIDNDISNSETEKYTEEINKNLEKLIVKKIDTIFKNTAIVIDEKKKKKSYINATARRIMFSLKGNSFAKNIDNLVKKVSKQSYDVYTTNYDFITESVFTEYNGHKNKPKNFLEEDHFIQLHGHYDVIGKSNIICCSPNEKIGKIPDEELEKFLGNIKKSDIIVLFGMGLTSDPHILNEINKKKSTDIIIIDGDKDKYYKNHYPKLNNNGIEEARKELTKESILADDSSFKFLVNNRINFIDTTSHEYVNRHYVDKINSPEKLIGLLEEIFESIAN